MFANGISETVLYVMAFCKHKNCSKRVGKNAAKRDVAYYLVVELLAY